MLNNKVAMSEVVEKLMTLNYAGGRQHETNVKEALISTGLVEVSRDMKLSMDKRLDLIQNNQFMMEPFSGQRPPDFVIMLENELIFIECKSQSEGVPFWNCHIPQHDWLYVVTSKKGTTVTMGKDLMTDNCRKNIPIANQLIRDFANKTYEDLGIRSKCYARINQGIEEPNVIKSKKRPERENNVKEYFLRFDQQ